QLYATVMQQWLCMNPAESETVLNGVYGLVPIFNGIVLPLDDILLVASWENGNAKLEFDVLENDTFDSFVIERSLDGTGFREINTVQNVTNNNRQSYVYLDPRINIPEIYYRIRGITKQSNIRYSKIVKIRNSNKQEVRIFPNPVTNHLINIEFLKPVNENVAITIYGSKGEKLYYNQINPGGSKVIRLKVPGYFDVQALYILNISFDDTIINEKIIFE
nr:T9SS type A sorting domain-containing protein [Ferruginibacter sp.]